MRSKPGFSRPCRCLSHLGGNVDRSIAPLGSRQGTDVLEDRRKIASKSRGKICLIPSPITFGLCLPPDVPPDGHAFRSPIDRPRSDGTFEDKRVFYVKDNP